MGKRKRKKRKDTKILGVTKTKGEDKGVSSGTGKVKIVSPNITDHRTFYVAANKYKLYVNAPKDYEKVYIQYFAGRDDGNEDALTVKNIKQDGKPLQNVNSEKIGPISLVQGSNKLFIEFGNSEIMAVIPHFTMEVSYEK